MPPRNFSTDTFQGTPCCWSEQAHKDLTGVPLSTEEAWQPLILDRPLNPGIVSWSLIPGRHRRGSKAGHPEQLQQTALRLPRGRFGCPALHQILLNLANNSLNFTDKGHERIQVSKIISAVAICGDRYGQGVSSSVFSRGANGKNTDCRRQPGQSWFAGCAARFRRALPAGSGGRSGSAGGRVERASPRIHALLAAALPIQRILVVDDEAGMRGWLTEVLEGAGHQVFTAQDGLQARALAKGQALDLVITDVSMPNEEGLGLIRALRKEHPHLQILAISGAFSPDVLTDAKLLGAHTALRKPVTKETVLQCVGNLSGVRPSEKV